MATQSAEKRLYRSRDAYVAGVCAGIADYFDLDAIVVRILAILLASLTLGLGVLVYLVLWVRTPRESEPSVPYDVMPESAESSAFGCVDCAPLPPERRASGKGEMGYLPITARLAVAAGVMVLFLLVSVNVSPLVPGTEWWQFWPVGFIIVGLCLIVIPVRSRYEAAWHALGIVATSLAASVLPMSLGILSWKTISCSFELLWPIVVLGVVLFCVGVYRKIDALAVAGAFCIVAFCLLGLTLCVLPGELEHALFQIPGGRAYRIVVFD